MKRYWGYIRPYLFFFLAGPLLMLTEVFGEITIPKMMSLIINNGVPNHDIAYILRVGASMVGFAMLMALGGDWLKNKSHKTQDDLMEEAKQFVESKKIIR